MSKKAKRRAARDAFPKSKHSAAAKKRGTGGAYSKRSYNAGSRQSGGRPDPKPPSMVRSLVIGAVVGFLYFVVIQWLIKPGDATTMTNVYFGLAGAGLFACVNYLTESFRYRRFLRKKDGSE